MLLPLCWWSWGSQEFCWPSNLSFHCLTKEKKEERKAWQRGNHTFTKATWTPVVEIMDRIWFTAQSPDSESWLGCWVDRRLGELTDRKDWMLSSEQTDKQIVHILLTLQNAPVSMNCSSLLATSSHNICYKPQVANTSPAGQIWPSTLLYPAQHLVSAWHQHRARLTVKE